MTMCNGPVEFLYLFMYYDLVGGHWILRIGSTGDIVKRTYEHRNKLRSRNSRYDVNGLFRDNCIFIWRHNIESLKLNKRELGESVMREIFGKLFQPKFWGGKVTKTDTFVVKGDNFFPHEAAIIAESFLIAKNVRVTRMQLFDVWQDTALYGYEHLPDQVYKSMLRERNREILNLNKLYQQNPNSI